MVDISYKHNFGTVIHLASNEAINSFRETDIISLINIELINNKQLIQYRTFQT